MFSLLLTETINEGFITGTINASCTGYEMSSEGVMTFVTKASNNTGWYYLLSLLRHMGSLTLVCVTSETSITTCDLKHSFIHNSDGTPHNPFSCSQKVRGEHIIEGMLTNMYDAFD
jgi:hypothetical protein